MLEADPPANTSSTEGESSPPVSTEQTIMDLMNKRNESIINLIQSLTTPPERVSLPTFDPNQAGVEARMWLSTANLCVDNQPLSGPKLIKALNKALKGEAQSWLMRVSYPRMTWTDFQTLFKARFCSKETTISALIKLFNSRPERDETMLIYANTQLNLLLARWENNGTEKMAIAAVLARIAQLEPIMSRVRFAKEVETRADMQKVIKILASRKRKAPSTNSDDDHSVPTTSDYDGCTFCSDPNHVVSTCQLKMLLETQNAATTARIIRAGTRCETCQALGHCSLDCPQDSQNTTSDNEEDPEEIPVDTVAPRAYLDTPE